MYARSVSVALLALPLLVSAVAFRRDIKSSCNNGSIQCCNSVQETHTTDSKNALAGLLGVDIGSIVAPIGITCNPLNVIGLSPTECASQAACCTGNSFNGAVVLGCTPINLNI